MCCFSLEAVVLPKYLSCLGIQVGYPGDSYWGRARSQTLVRGSQVVLSGSFKGHLVMSEDILIVTTGGN